MASSAQDAGSGYAAYASGAGQVAGSLWANQTNRDATAATNASNLMLQERQQRWAKNERYGTQKFSEKMSNTAMQRMVRDYKKAGINPMLGLSGGGASSPTSSAGSVSSATSQAATAENPLAGLAATAYQAEQIKLATNRQKEELENMKAERTNTEALTGKAKMETHMLQKGLPKMEAENMLWNSAKELMQKSVKDRVHDSMKLTPEQEKVLNKIRQKRKN